MNDNGSKFYYSRLTDGEKNLYDRICEALLRFEPALSLHAGMGKAFTVDTGKIMTAVLFDNPVFFYLNRHRVIVKQTPMYIQLIFQYDYTKEEAEQRVDRTLEELGLMDLKHRYNHKISGGEKRMAAIATILAMEPQVILMDEPSTALDPVNRRTVIRTINDLTMTKLIASHDLDMILDTCDRVILLSHGCLAADGPAEQILRDQKLLEANRMELPFCLAGPQRQR